MSSTYAVAIDQTQCDHCNGYSVTICPQCSGKGFLPIFRGISRLLSIWKMQIGCCSTCNGCGSVPCEHCTEKVN